MRVEDTMRVYIGATRQNDGKTITCLGLISAFKRRLEKVGYTKPVGQRYVDIDGAKIDEDALLVKTVYEPDCEIRDMSPIAIPRHFTENYIDSPHREELIDTITTAFNRVRVGKNIVVVEGTGHAGVGSVFDLSNGDVAALLGCKVVLIASGGIGRPIDEIMLNKAMFDAAGVTVVGAIVNKVEDEKYEKVKRYVRLGLERKGVDLLGVMPYRSALSSPTIGQLLEDIDGKLLSGNDGLQNNVEKMVIGAMPPHQALDYLTKGALLITPGTREDLILTAISSCLVGSDRDPSIAGMILTGGTPPQPNVAKLLDRIAVPSILVEEDTYSVASRIAKLIVKIRPGDFQKISTAEEIVDEYVDVDRLLEKLHD